MLPFTGLLKGYRIKKKLWAIQLFPLKVREKIYKLSTINTYKSTKHQNCPQLMPESMLQITKMYKVNHTKVSENSLIYRIVRATLSD